MIGLNNKGTVLNLVLVIFLNFTFFMNLYLDNAMNQYDIYKNIVEMNKQKNYEILLIQYFRYTIDNDILLSDEIEIDEYYFRYVVDVDYGSYIIKVSSDHPFFDYIFLCEIDMDSLNIISYDYLKEV